MNINKLINDVPFHVPNRTFGNFENKSHIRLDWKKQVKEGNEFMTGDGRF